MKNTNIKNSKKLLVIAFLSIFILVAGMLVLSFRPDAYGEKT